MGKWQRFKEKNRWHWKNGSFKDECAHVLLNWFKPVERREEPISLWDFIRDAWRMIVVTSDRAWKKLILGHKFYDTEPKKIPEKMPMKQGFFNARVNNMQRDFAARRK